VPGRQANSPIQDIIIVGAGFAGLGLGVRLKRETAHSFIVLERAGDVGGTWRDNTYPGAACDVSSHLYSYSFRPNPNWTQVYSSQREIHEYLRETARAEGLLDHVQFNQEVTAADWDEATGVWVVRCGEQEYRGRSLVLASGRLSDPKMPDLPGLGSFTGALFHSAAWDDSADLEGKRIGVIGTGASAIQIIPELAKVAGHLTVFQRSAAYVRPRTNRKYSEVEKRAFARAPESLMALREDMFWANEARLVERQALPALLEKASADAHAHREAQVHDPVLRELLRPNYVFGCKRGLKSNDYYPTFNLPHVTLQASGITRVEGNVVHAKDGRTHELDVIVAATGVEATDLPISYRVRGANARPLSDAWANGMQAYATISPHGFPNLFVMGGPNTGLGHNSAIYIVESQVEYLLGAFRFLLAQPGRILEALASAEEEFMRHLETKMEGTVWLSDGCQTWYIDSRNGRLTSLWPDFAHGFRRENGTFDQTAYEVRQTADTGVDTLIAR
jgi:cation diffusion facilitator CzcD-associated flavoprotein CzcO